MKRMQPARRRAGHTLIEIVVAASVFFIVLAVGSDLLVTALRSTAEGEKRQAALDETRQVMYRLSSELRRADEILDPPWTGLALEGSTYLVFSTRTEILGYRLEGDRVIRRTFQPGYTPGVPGTQIPLSARVLTSAPSTLRFDISGNGPPPGHGGVAPGQDGDPGGGIGLALGHWKQTVQVRLSVAPDGMPPLAMRTKRTLWGGLFPEPKKEETAVAAPGGPAQ